MKQIFLLYKKKGKDPENSSSYRPIVLLNSDLKLLSKILALSLEKVLPFIINEDQTGFAKGRSSTHNVRRLLNIIELSHYFSFNSLILSLDAEQAFDPVEFILHLRKIWTWEMLYKLGVNTLYRSSCSCHYECSKIS